MNAQVTNTNTFDFTKGVTKFHAPLGERSNPLLMVDAPVHSDQTMIMGFVHEIRSPLSNINLSLAYLSSEISNPDLITHMSIIERSTKRINDLVCLLLRPKSESSVEQVKVCALLDQTMILCSDMAKLRNIKIQTDYRYNGRVLVERALFSLALSNIVMNAIEAVQAGDGIITLRTESDEDYCTFTISDNGTGIHCDDLDRIFSTHFSRKETGTGVGLAVTKEILERHGAQIHVESTYGSGTQFSVKMKSF